MAWVEITSVRDDCLKELLVNTDNITFLATEFDVVNEEDMYQLYTTHDGHVAIDKESYDKLMDVIKSEQSPKQKWHPHFNYERREDDLR